MKKLLTAAVMGLAVTVIAAGPRGKMMDRKDDYRDDRKEVRKEVRKDDRRDDHRIKAVPQAKTQIKPVPQSSRRPQVKPEPPKHHRPQVKPEPPKHHRPQVKPEPPKHHRPPKPVKEMSFGERLLWELLF